jgi:hypothetical protein
LVGCGQSKKFFHRNTAAFGFGLGQNTIRQPTKVSGVFFSDLTVQSL